MPPVAQRATPPEDIWKQMKDAEGLKQALVARALEEGFSKAGICAPDAVPETAARLAAKRATAQERRAIEQAQNRCRDLADHGPTGAYESANVAFHASIHQAAHNDLLTAQIHQLRTRVAGYTRDRFDSPGRMRRSCDEHDQVVAAILAGDERGAWPCPRAPTTSLPHVIFRPVLPESRAACSVRRPLVNRSRGDPGGVGADGAGSVTHRGAFGPDRR